jgi:hypothetical protein
MRLRTGIKPYIFCVFLLIFACKLVPVNVEHTDSEQCLVIRAFAKPYSGPLNLPGTVYGEVAILQSMNNYSLFDSVKDATFVIYGALGEADTLMYDNYAKRYSKNKIIESNSVYTLSVHREGFPSVFAEDIIPDMVPIDSVLINPFFSVDALGSAIGTATIFFSDAVDIHNYYEIQVSRGINSYCDIFSDDPIITGEFYYPANIAFNNYSPKRLLFTDNGLVNKQSQINVSFYTGSSFSADESGGKHIIESGFIGVYFRTVSKNYYSYWSSFLDYSFNFSGDVLFGTREASNIFTNIQNGYGVFGSYQECYSEIYIDQIIY